jgi:hypothetical protein
MRGAYCHGQSPSRISIQEAIYQFISLKSYIFSRGDGFIPSLLLPRAIGQRICIIMRPPLFLILSSESANWQQRDATGKGKRHFE